MYVKLISDGTWFIEGTEVFHYDEDRRITKEEFDEWRASGSILCRGIRLRENGEKYIDGELCAIEEFSVELVEEYITKW